MCEDYEENYCWICGRITIHYQDLSGHWHCDEHDEDQENSMNEVDF